MVSKNEVTKERRKELLEKAKKLSDAWMSTQPVNPDLVSVSITEQKWGIHIEFKIKNNATPWQPIRISSGIHIDYDIQDEALDLYIKYILASSKTGA